MSVAPQKTRSTGPLKAAINVGYDADRPGWYTINRRGERTYLEEAELAELKFAKAYRDKIWATENGSRSEEPLVPMPAAAWEAEKARRAKSKGRKKRSRKKRSREEPVPVGAVSRPVVPEFDVAAWVGYAGLFSIFEVLAPDGGLAELDEIVLGGGGINDPRLLGTFLEQRFVPALRKLQPFTGVAPDVSIPPEARPAALTSLKTGAATVIHVYRHGPRPREPVESVACLAVGEPDYRDPFVEFVLSGTGLRDDEGWRKAFVHASVPAGSGGPDPAFGVAKILGLIVGFKYFVFA